MVSCRGQETIPNMVKIVTGSILSVYQHHIINHFAEEYIDRLGDYLEEYYVDSMKRLLT